MKHVKSLLDSPLKFTNTLHFHSDLEPVNGISANYDHSYKAGTAIFLSRLAEVGKKCGADLNKLSVPAPQLTAEKANKKAYTISIQHFITLAQMTADSTPKIIVPRLMLNLLSDVIHLRKEVSVMVAGGASQRDHDGHVYFVLVIERVREILKPLGKKEVPVASAGATTRAKNVSPAPNEILSNIFEALDLEEPTFTSTISAQSSRTPTLKASKCTYDIESALDDILVSSMLFFRDLKKIREFMCSVWDEYKRGLVDLTTASRVVSLLRFKQI